MTKLGRQGLCDGIGIDKVGPGPIALHAKRDMGRAIPGSHVQIIGVDGICNGQIRDTHAIAKQGRFANAIFLQSLTSQLIKVVLVAVLVIGINQGGLRVLFFFLRRLRIRCIDRDDGACGTGNGSQPILKCTTRQKETVSSKGHGHVQNVFSRHQETSGHGMGLVTGIVPLQKREHGFDIDPRVVVHNQEIIGQGRRVVVRSWWFMRVCFVPGTVLVMSLQQIAKGLQRPFLRTQPQSRGGPFQKFSFGHKVLGNLRQNGMFARNGERIMTILVNASHLLFGQVGITIDFCIVPFRGGIEMTNRGMRGKRGLLNGQSIGTHFTANAQNIQNGKRRRRRDITDSLFMSTWSGRQCRGGGCGGQGGCARGMVVECTVEASAAFRRIVVALLVQSQKQKCGVIEFLKFRLRLGQETNLQTTIRDPHRQGQTDRHDPQPHPLESVGRSSCCWCHASVCMERRRRNQNDKGTFEETGTRGVEDLCYVREVGSIKYKGVCGNIYSYIFFSEMECKHKRRNCVTPHFTHLWK